MLHIRVLLRNYFGEFGVVKLVWIIFILAGFEKPLELFSELQLFRGGVCFYKVALQIQLRHVSLVEGSTICHIQSDCILIGGIIRINSSE